MIQIVGKNENQMENMAHDMNSDDLQGYLSLTGRKRAQGMG